jgi:hypothetical protein
MRPRTIRKLELFHHPRGRGILGVSKLATRKVGTVREVNIGGRLLITRATPSCPHTQPPGSGADD